MPEDRFGNPLSTTSAAARDAYVEGCDLQLALWAGADAARAEKQRRRAPPERRARRKKGADHST